MVLGILMFKDPGAGSLFSIRNFNHRICAGEKYAMTRQLTMSLILSTVALTGNVTHVYGSWVCYVVIVRC